MTHIYTHRDEKILEEAREKDRMIKEHTGEEPKTSTERERIWRAIQDIARSG